MSDNGQAKCSACGATEHLRSSIWHSPHLICRPCFILWYDPPIACDVTDPAALGALSNDIRTKGEWPWSKYETAPPEPQS